MEPEVVLCRYLPLLETPLCLHVECETGRYGVFYLGLLVVLPRISWVESGEPGGSFSFLCRALGPSVVPADYWT